MAKYKINYHSLIESLENNSINILKGYAVIKNMMEKISSVTDLSIKDEIKFH